MEVAVQPVAVGELPKQEVKLRHLFTGERRQKLRFMLFGDPAQLTQYPLAGIGEAEFVVPPVGAAAHPFHQTAFLEGVDEGHHPAGDGTQPVSQGALAQSGRAAKQADDTGVARREADLARALGKTGRRHGAQLRQEECCPF